MGDSTMKVIGMYRKEGLSGSVDARELPDHVAVELEFMSYLVFAEIKALEASDLRAAIEAVAKQERFSAEFLRSELPDHVAVELEFMSYLVFAEIKALEASDLRAAIEAVAKQERFSAEFL